MSEERTQSGIPLRRFYEPQDVQHVHYGRDLNTPGAFPFTRGRNVRFHSGETWIQRELSGEGDPERSNRQLKYLIAKGQTGIDVIGDSPTMACLDPDHPLCAQAVGTQGGFPMLQGGLSQTLQGYRPGFGHCLGLAPLGLRDSGFLPGSQALRGGSHHAQGLHGAGPVFLRGLWLCHAHAL